MLTIDDVCRMLSISRATARNWIRLGRLVPDVGAQSFSREYVETFAAELKSGEHTKLRSRRNKTNATGKILYKDYIHTESNRSLVEELLESALIEDETDLLVVLANFAVQLYYQSRGIRYAKNDVLGDFLSQNHTDDFDILVRDLIGNVAPDSAWNTKLHDALTKELRFVKGEDSLGFVYISLRDIGRRKRSGVYYTPETVVHQLIERLYENDRDLGRRTICDPCCGTGNFLLGLGAEGINPANLYGQDMDPVSVYLARMNVALMAPELSAADICSRIITGNTYFETFARKFDVILGNPPWGSNFSEEEIRRCRKLFRTAAGNNMESCELFVEKSLTMLGLGGVMAFVLPEAMLNVAAHDAVRRLLLASCSFRFVSYLGNVFPGVQCPSVILGVAPDDHPTVSGCKVTTDNKHFVVSRPRCFPDGTFPFRVSDAEYECLNAIDSVEPVAYLKGNARFALGIVTGNNKEYLSREKLDDNEAILKESDIRRYGIAAPENYIRFEPERFQQVAPIELYRAKEKLLYRFISEVPVFAYDDQQRLSLNSCNIVIPEIPGLDMRYVLAVLNSSVATYYFFKKFHSVKMLRSHIEQMPVPVVSSEIQAEVIRKVDRIMHSFESRADLYADLDEDMMGLFRLNADQTGVIREALQGKRLFLEIDK
ncbi:MAG: N-6 DNA methylase [Clostridiales bacterium]|nr:N-6 DNA methylase [Clostridiales bacterium]